MDVNLEGKDLQISPSVYFTLMPQGPDGEVSDIRKYNKKEKKSFEKIKLAVFPISDKYFKND